jgi:hypothetical protein
MHHENCEVHHLHTKGSKVETWFCSGLQSNGRRSLLKTSARPTARTTSWEVNYWSAAVGGLGTLLLQQNNKFHESVVVRRCSKCGNKHKTCTKKLIRVKTLRLTVSHHPIIQLGTYVEHFQTCVEWRKKKTGKAPSPTVRELQHLCHHMSLDHVQNDVTDPLYCLEAKPKNRMKIANPFKSQTIKSVGHRIFAQPLVQHDWSNIYASSTLPLRTEWRHGSSRDIPSLESHEYRQSIVNTFGSQTSDNMCRT